MAKLLTKSSGRSAESHIELEKVNRSALRNKTGPQVLELHFRTHQLWGNLQKGEKLDRDELIRVHRLTVAEMKKRGFEHKGIPNSIDGKMDEGFFLGEMDEVDEFKEWIPHQASWNGIAGKRWLASTIVPVFPPHRIYVEPFFGGGSIFFYRENRSQIEVVNDRDPEIANALKVVKAADEGTVRALNSMNWTKNRPYFFKIKNLDPERLSPLQRFHRFFMLNRYSYSGNRKTWGNRTDQSPASIMAWVEKKMLAYGKRLHGVKILSQDYERVVRDHDGPDTFFYMDPPYQRDLEPVIELGGKFDHERFAKVSMSIKGKVVISYDDTPENNQRLRGLVIRKVNSIRSENHNDFARRVEILAANYNISPKNRFDEDGFREMITDEEGAHEPHEDGAGAHDHKDLPPNTGEHDHDLGDPNIALGRGAHRHREDDEFEGAHFNKGDSWHVHMKAQKLPLQAESDEQGVELHLKRPWLPGLKKIWIRERSSPEEEFPDTFRESTKLDWEVHMKFPMHEPYASGGFHAEVFLSEDRMIDKMYEFEDGTMRAPTKEDFQKEEEFFSKIKGRTPEFYHERISQSR